jgi:pimeloyl-ACP methyl ester carboxylesterase
MPSTGDVQMVTMSDGRKLEVLVDGSPDQRVLFYHSGTPSGATPYRLLSEAVAGRDLCLVTASRPGYGESDPAPGRSVADVAGDVTSVLDFLGADRFLTFGWSGGGPHALACAALLPGRCSGAAVLAGVAPYEAEGLDWLAGMGPENVEEFGAAMAGPQELTAFLEAARTELANVTGEQVGEAMGGLAPPVDRAALTGELADYVAASFRQAMLRGTAGWRDDDLAFVKPWGFDLADISVPVAIWQGGQDRMVPYDHGKWLAAHVPNSEVRLYDDEGHLSLLAQFGRIVDDLVELVR